MTTSRIMFSQEFKDELCQEAISTSKPIREVAESYSVGLETLRNWLVEYRDANGGTEEDLTLTGRARLKELKRENQDLRAETVFLKNASAYFAREQSRIQLDVATPAYSIKSNSSVHTTAGVRRPRISHSSVVESCGDRG